MTLDEFIKAFFNYAIPTLSIALAIISMAVTREYYFDGKTSEKKAQDTLDELDRRSKGWQDNMMRTVNESLLASPNITANKLFTKKLEMADKIVKMIEEASVKYMEDPEREEAWKKMVETHYNQLDSIFNGVISQGQPVGTQQKSGQDRTQSSQNRQRKS